MPFDLHRLLSAVTGRSGFLTILTVYDRDPNGYEVTGRSFVDYEVVKDVESVGQLLSMVEDSNP